MHHATPPLAPRPSAGSVPDVAHPEVPVITCALLSVLLLSVFALAALGAGGGR